MSADQSGSPADCVVWNHSVNRLLAPVADSLIVGSAFVRRMEEAVTNRKQALADIGALAKELIGAMPRG